MFYCVLPLDQTDKQGVTTRLAVELKLSNGEKIKADMQMLDPHIYYGSILLGNKELPV